MRCHSVCKYEMSIVVWYGVTTKRNINIVVLFESVNTNPDAVENYQLMSSILS